VSRPPPPRPRAEGSYAARSWRSPVANPSCGLAIGAEVACRPCAVVGERRLRGRLASSAFFIQRLALTPVEDRFSLQILPLRRIFGVPLPFQSAGQALSALAAVSVGALIVMALVRLLGGAFDGAGIVFVIVGAAAGGSPIVSMTRSTVLTVKTHPQGYQYWRRRVHGRLEFHGYQLARTSPADGNRYCSRLPHWLRWRENEFVLSSQHDGERRELIVTGPWLTNKLLLKALRQPTS
jgi:hypothetical protein